ncbi:hypothetical protein PoB_001028200 [Plakobranchus ocellatus]|uniref:Uncharacterized protein n=1 Tax=Plakobranchus ocellatus TaxID=259542 RepID=A0AAV3YLH7_9GAST|nr:hypothetical protein PoB_001028200 [Plakobranchus ocellatus]
MASNPCLCTGSDNQSALCISWRHSGSHTLWRPTPVSVQVRTTKVLSVYHGDILALILYGVQPLSRYKLGQPKCSLYIMETFWLSYSMASNPCLGTSSDNQSAL